ncbi:hypothetical protein C1Y63_02320 [Corynebacterium sp. 13CS0277]|uniref:type II secretion system F family protein n=1 Tax=Corynebacterium sp. 13CS0277 TaxID=2071994 RepID=UPI000D0335BF|nr:type II secretion system F family protein [Corynebacterium sp. 13CS0277]PRQ12167.1 hypothetical protein C1Y63_02320 [Corynebacterium sp. 13CS0277]
MTTHTALACLLLAAALLIPHPRPIARTCHTRRPRAGPWLIAGACVMLLVVASRPALAATGIVLAGTATWSIRNARMARAAARDADALAGLLTTLAAQLQAGSPPGAALQHTAARLPPGTPEQLARLFRAAAAQPAAAADIFTSHPSAHVTRLGVLWATASRAGIPTAHLLTCVRNQLDAHTRHQRATHAQLQGAKATAWILTALPGLGMLLGHGMGAHPWEFLTTTTLGSGLLLTGTALSCAGFITTRLIIHHATRA